MKAEKEYYKCEHCGHDKFVPDRFAEIKGVKRVVLGNGICAKCKKPVPVDLA